MELMDVSKMPFSREVAERYGYTSLANKRGMWPVQPGVLQNLALLPQALDESKKIRIIFDYDPNFHRALVQVFEDEAAGTGATERT